MTERPKYVWVFDPNRRVYKPAAPGDLWSKEGPIWRKQWVRHEIVGQTSRSWIDRYGRKYPRGVVADIKQGFSFDEAVIDRTAWVQENRHRLADRIRAMDFDQLAKLAEALQYEPAPPGINYGRHTDEPKS
jgi:hypothetical protein